MAERIRTIEHRRRVGALAAKNAPPGEKISHERLAARNELVGEHEPRTCLDAAGLEQRAELAGALRSNAEVVLEHHGLSVEEKALAGGGRIVQQLVDERHEPLAE